MKLYEKDAYLHEWETEVLSVEKGPDGSFVELKETAFHPQGGGQPGDKGLISAAGNPVRVIDTILSKGKILSKVEGFPPTGLVKCSLDWPHRYRLMKTHSGEHLLVGSLLKVARGIEIDKVVIGELEGKIFARGEATIEEILAAERKANEVIFQNRPISHKAIELCDAKEKFANLRVKEDKIKGDLRVMAIDDYDAAACSGTHVRSTSEIGAVKVTKILIGGCTLEISFAVGEKAFEEAFDLANQTIKAAAATGTETGKLAEASANSKNELSELKSRLYERSKQAAEKPLEPIETKFGTCYLNYLPDIERIHALKLANRLIKEKCFVVLAGGAISGWFVCAKNGTNAPIEQFARQIGRYGGQDDFFTGSPEGEIEDKFKKLAEELKLTGR